MSHNITPVMQPTRPALTSTVARRLGRHRAFHALLGALLVRGQNALRRHLIVAKETAGRARFTPAVAGLRDARRQFRRKSFHQCSRSPVEASIAKIQCSKCLLRPTLRYLGQCVTHIQGVSAIWPECTSPDFFGQAGWGGGLVYDDMTYCSSQVNHFLSCRRLGGATKLFFRSSVRLSLN